MTPTFDTQDSNCSQDDLDMLDAEMSLSDDEDTRMALIEGLAAPHANWFGSPVASQRVHTPPLVVQCARTARGGTKAMEDFHAVIGGYTDPLARMDCNKSSDDNSDTSSADAAWSDLVGCSSQEFYFVPLAHR